MVWAQLLPPFTGSPSLLSSNGLLTPALNAYKLGTGTSNRRPTYPPASPLRSNELTWYRNINLLSIGYALQPRLRTD